MRPLLLLDVDGVLNCPDGKRRRERLEGCGRRSRSWPGGVCCASRGFCPTDFTRAFMAWAWRHFEVRWMTAWGDHGNAIARWAGLRRRPAAADPKDRRQDADNGYTYKFAAAKRLACVSRPVVWIEDGISADELAWVRDRDNWLYVETDPFQGVTVRQCVMIWRWVELARSLDSVPDRDIKYELGRPSGFARKIRPYLDKLHKRPKGGGVR